MGNKPNKSISAVQQKQKLFTVKPVKETSVSTPKWWLVALIVFTALLYTKSIYNGFTSFDDDFYILKNPFIRNFSIEGVTAIFSSFYESNYHPLTTLTYLFEFKFFGINPLPYHLLNVLLHLVNTVLVFKVAEHLSGKKITALVVSVLFAVHPMHVESVAWVSERKDVLYATFYLWSLLVYIRYISSGFRTKYYIIALILFVVSLLSKSAAVTLPVLLIAVDLYKGRSVTKKSLMEKVPFFLLSILFGIINIYAQKAGGPVNILFEYYGAINGLFLFTSGIALYLIRALVPFNLSAMHYFPFINGGGLPWLYYLSLPFIVFIAWLVFKRRKNAAIRKEIIFGISFFLISISVMLQLVSVGSALTAERYTYIPYIGLFYLAGQWLAGLSKTEWHKPATGIFFLIVIVYSVQTWDRVGVWQNDETILTDVIEKNPNILDVNLIYLLRGKYRAGTGNLKDALNDFTVAIEMNPGFAFEYKAYYLRGTILDDLNDMKGALSDYDNSIRLNAKFADAYNSRGWLYYRMRNTDSAIADYNKAIALNPAYAEAYNNRGWAYNGMGNAKAAIFDYDKAISLNPSFEKPRFNRAGVKAATGDFEGAIEDYSYMLRLHPDDNVVYYSRGMTRFNQKNIPGACEDWNKAAEYGNKDAVQMMQQYCR